MVIGLKTCERPYKIQGCVSKPTGSTLYRSPLPFKGLEKLTNTQALLSEPSNISRALLRFANIPAAALIGPKVLLRVYLNEELQDNI